MSKETFNSNPKIISAFKNTAAAMLKVPTNTIKHVRACAVGSTDADCATTNNRLRRVDDATDSEVRYEIETETKEEMNSVQVSVTGTAYQENNAFSTQFKSAMKTEGVDTDVVASMVGVEPDAGAQAVEQDIDGNDMPAETPTNDASSD